MKLNLTELVYKEKPKFVIPMYNDMCCKNKSYSKIRIFLVLH